jgi:phosphatidylinositol-3-phosphatase
MTQAQQRLVAVVSVLSTILVLVAGGGAFDSDLQLAAAAKRVKLDIPGPVGGESTADDLADDGDSTAEPPASAEGGGETADSAVPADDGFGDESGSAPAEDPKPSKIEHVFVIALAGHGFDATFGPASVAPYLSKELRPKGALLEEYGSLGTADLPDLIAMVGGQPPNDATRAGCPTFEEFPQTVAPSRSGEIAASGCAYPSTVTTVADQITASGNSWRAYVEDIDKGPAGAILCRRPQSDAPDDTVKGRPGDGYATRHNPFAYFHSLLDLGDCDANDGPLAPLEHDLAAAKTTPNLAWIAPNLCNDGTESPCADGSPGGLAAADAFLADWVPKILDSPAYKSDGLLIVTFAGGVAPGSPPEAEQGVRNGTLLVSKFAEPGSTVGGDYDPYSLLRSVEDLFALRPLARAAKASSFADTVLADALVEPPSD